MQFGRSMTPKTGNAEPDCKNIFQLFAHTGWMTIVLKHYICSDWSETRYVVGRILHQHLRSGNAVNRHFVVWDKRKIIIAAESARQSSSNRFDGDEDSLKIENSINFASDSVQKKKRDSEARSSVRCWNCDRKGHKSVRRRRGIGMETLINIKGGSTRSCECVLRTLMGQSLLHLPVTSVS